MVADSSVGSQGGGGADSFGPLHRPLVNPGNIETFITQNVAGFAITNRQLGFSLQAASSGTPAMTAVKPLHAKPYDVIIAVSAVINQVISAHQASGLCMRESASGKLVTFGPNNEAWGNVIGVAHWTDASTPVSHTDNNIIGFANVPTYVRVTDDGITRSFYLSPNGLEFVSMLTEPSGTWCEPDQVGFIFQCDKSGGNRMAFHVQSLEIVT